jgi:hypothetical protein
MKKVIFILLASTGLCHAQSTINVSSNHTNQHDYSIGEMTLVNTAKSSNGSLILTQGYLQPNFNFVLVKQNNGEETVLAYPNPTNGILNLECKNLNQKINKVIIMNSVGKTINEFDGSQLQKQQIDLSTISNANYFVIVETELEKSKTKTTFKIEKQ